MTLSGFGSVVRAFEGKTISKIEVTGLKRIEVDAILGKIGSAQGKPARKTQIAEDIRAIHKMGFFQEVEVQSKDETAKDLTLVYALKERPVIAEIHFDGNEKIDTDDLKEVIKIKEWSILDVNLIREDVDRLQKHYEDKGFFLARVSHVIEPIKDDELKVVFKINDYEKVQIKKITFLNNKVFSDEKLKSVMRETQEGGFFSFLSDAGNFKESAFKQDLQMITLWYLDNGYVKFSFESPVITISEDKKYLYISVYVHEGEQYSMGEIDFSGDLLFKKDELHESIVLTEGKKFRISERNLDIQTLTEKYQDLGYAFVNVIPKLKIDDEKKTVDVDYSFEKGNLVYFGEINIVGNTKTFDKVIRRELRVNEGELFSGSGVRISRERVERLGFFAPGEVTFNTLTRKGRDDLVDLEIRIKERSTGTITLGAGYGSVQGFFFTTQISEINLMGRGHQLSFQAQYSTDALTQSFNLGFTDPYAFDTKWSMGFDLFYVLFPIPGRYQMRKLGFDVRLGYPLMDDLNAYITYKNEGLRILKKENTNVDSSDEGVLSSVVWSLVRDKRNNRFEPTSGNYQNLSVETAGFGGDKRFVKMNLNNRYYTRVIGDLVFRTSQEFGQIFQVSDTAIPSSERFLLGGPNNLKGFRSLSVGPREPGLPTVPRGGLVQMFTLFEIEYPLIREAGLKWVMFYDAGNSFESFPGTNGEPFRFKHDAGFGFRWFSPIGPLRFEWGFPLGTLDTASGETSSEFQFMIGPPF